MELAAFGDIDRFGTNDIEISWLITEGCNFKCWYCDFAKLKSPKIPSLETINSIIDKIREISEFRHISKIDLYSAEPTTISNLDVYLSKLVEMVSDNGYIRIATNLSKTIDEYKKIIDSVLLHNKKFIISPSFHKEYINVYDFFDKINILSNIYKNTKFELSKPTFMIHSEECIELAHTLHNTVGYEHNIFSMYCIREIEDLEFEQIWDEKLFNKEKEKIIGIYKDNDYKYKDNDYTRFSVFNFRKHICRCWSQNIVIHPNGDITPCISIKNLGKQNLFDDGIIDFIKNTENVICPSYKCFCDPGVPKYKMLEYNKLKEWTREDIEKLEKL
jgi:MoaA/NifB/PqqE/SkfB family radical SAM enzyme